MTAVCVIFTALFFVLNISALDEPDVSKAESVCVYNLENDKMLFSKGENESVSPASAAKMMTGVLACEHFKDRADETVTITEESLKGYRGKNISLKAGETVTVRDLLYAVICGGANDASYVIAYQVSGSVGAFVDQMNSKASELGMKDTVFTNPSGYFDSNMRTTANDVLKLAKYAYGNESYMKMSSEVSYTMPKTDSHKERYIYNSNYLISTNIEKKYRNSEAMGMSAGMTLEGGNVVVTAVSKNGMTDFYIIMGVQSDDEKIYAYTIANELIDWSYKSYAYVKVIDAGEMVSEAKVNLSRDVDYVMLSPEKSLELFLPADINVEKDIERVTVLNKDEFDAPVEAGAVVGSIALKYKGEEIGRVDLVTKNSVDCNEFLYVLARIQSFTRNKNFKIALIVAAVVFVLYILLSVRRAVARRRAIIGKRRKIRRRR